MEGKDPMGKWVYTKYATTIKRVVTVATAYQARKSSSKTGMMTSHQQVVMLKQQNRTEDPRKAFIKDLLELLKIGHDKGEHFIIGNNYNDTLDIKTKLIKLCTYKTLQLVDVLKSNQCNGISTSLSGRSVIDYVFVSCKHVSSFVCKGYNKYNQIKHTDHFKMYIDMDTEKLFGNGDIKLATESSCFIEGHNPHNVKLYVNAMWQYLEGQQYRQKYPDLMKSEAFNKKNTEK
eukprot:1841072-Ditylum_brightwellii.AAC.2